MHWPISHAISYWRIAHNCPNLNDDDDWGSYYITRQLLWLYVPGNVKFDQSGTHPLSSAEVQYGHLTLHEGETAPNFLLAYHF